MLNRFAIVPLIFVFALTACKRHAALVNSAQAANSPSPTGSAPGAKGLATPSAPPVVNPSPPAAKSGKVVVDQTAQVIIFCYHRLVDKIRYPGTEIKPADFEAQMKALKDRGITVIGMQDFLAWKRGEKNIPPRSAIVTFDDGWKSQYDVAWPIMKKF